MADIVEGILIWSVKHPIGAKFGQSGVVVGRDGGFLHARETPLTDRSELALAWHTLLNIACC
jgi:hypothetical protein